MTLLSEEELASAFKSLSNIHFRNSAKDVLAAHIASQAAEIERLRGEHGNLRMLVVRLTRQLPAENPVRAASLKYLFDHGLAGSPLREKA